MKSTANMIIRSSLLCIALGFTASAQAGENFEKAWSTADSKRLEAAAINYEWRDTGKLLQEAKQTHAKGDKDKAMALVEQAQAQSIAALAQAERESELWQNRVPK